MLIQVNLYRCFSLHAVILCKLYCQVFITRRVCSCKQHSMADHHAPGNCTKPPLSLPCTEGRFPFSPNSFSAQMWCFCAGTKATVYHNVFFLCLERGLECMLLTAIKMFCSVTFLLQLTVCPVRAQTLSLILLKFLSPALKIINYQRIRQHSRNQKGL